MIALEQTRQHLESLGLKQAAEALDNALDAAAGKQLTYPRCSPSCWAWRSTLAASATSPREPSSRICPFQRSIEQFDFDFQPSVDERQVKKLANLAFVAEATNILLLGPPGVGKTHLAVAFKEKRQAGLFTSHDVLSTTPDGQTTTDRIAGH